MSQPRTGDTQKVYMDISSGLYMKTNPLMGKSSNPSMVQTYSPTQFRRRLSRELPQRERERMSSSEFVRVSKFLWLTFSKDAYQRVLDAETHYSLVTSRILSSVIYPEMQIYFSPVTDFMSVPLESVYVIHIPLYPKEEYPIMSSRGYTPSDTILELIPQLYDVYMWENYPEARHA